MKSITVSKEDERDIREIFKEAGFDKRDVDMKMNHINGTVTYSQPDLPKKMRPLSLEMRKALEYIKEHDNVIFRHPGGYWAHEHWLFKEETWVRTTTIQALVDRGLLKYTAWKSGRNGKFPIRAEIS